MKYEEIETLPFNKAYLHFEAVKSYEGYQVDYELVLPLSECDCRGTFDKRGASKRPKSYKSIWLDKQNNKRFPLGRTNVGTDNPEYPFSRHPMYEGEIDLPFRDNAHCAWDNEKLGGLQVIYSVRDKHYLILKVGNE